MAKTECKKTILFFNQHFSIFFGGQHEYTEWYYGCRVVECQGKVEGRRFYETHAHLVRHKPHYSLGHLILAEGAQDKQFLEFV
jgi:hypothetical protein